VSGTEHLRPEYAEARVALPKRYDFDETLRFVRLGPGDPTCRRGHGWLVKAARSAHGPVTVSLVRPAGAPLHVVARAWGPGAQWTIARVEGLLGLRDTPGAFAPSGPLAEPARRYSGTHLCRSPWPWEAVYAAVLQQRVRFPDALAAHRRLTRWCDERAPAPVGADGTSPPPHVADLLLPPSPERLAEVPPDLWRRAGIESRRVAVLRGAARNRRRLHQLCDETNDRARTCLQSLPGCGPWTVATIMGRYFGDPDAVPVGDVHLPHIVCWALAGLPRGDDGRMLQLLEPFRPHRFRVIRLLWAEGIEAPRHGRYGAAWDRRRARAM
jgi:3-methyladenine DNA glycosylase/8-oxoguanine DNA glycosylase